MVLPLNLTIPGEYLRDLFRLRSSWWNNPCRALGMLYHPSVWLLWLLRVKGVKARNRSGMFSPGFAATVWTRHCSCSSKAAKGGVLWENAALKRCVLSLKDWSAFVHSLFGLAGFPTLGHTNLLPDPTQRAEESPWVNKNCMCVLKYKLQWVILSSTKSGLTLIQKVDSERQKGTDFTLN